MSNLTGRGLAIFASAKLGTPYVYGAKGSYGVLTRSHLTNLIAGYHNVFTKTYIAKAMKYIDIVCTDCSGLISWYTGKILGSAQMYSTATKRGLIKDLKDAPIGAVLWRSGHVGVYIGDGDCIEARGIDYGTVQSKVSRCRFTHWLLFENLMTYESDIISEVTYKPSNPYPTPKFTIISTMRCDDVKWVQWELRQAGYNVDIDGVFGKQTLKAVKQFQASCKLTVDGKVGPLTRAAFIAN